MGSYPSRLPFLWRRWCVLPKVTQGRKYVTRQRSTGLKQPKKDVYHGLAPSGERELTTSPGLARTSFTRFVQCSTSRLSIGPLLCCGEAIVRSCFWPWLERMMKSRSGIKECLSLLCGS